MTANGYKKRCNGCCRLMKEWEFPWQVDAGGYDENCNDCYRLFSQARGIGGDELVAFARTLFLLDLSHNEISNYLPLYFRSTRNQGE